MDIDWDEKKNELLKKVRGLNFEDIAADIAAGRIVEVFPSPSRPGQLIFVIERDGYMVVCPAVPTETGYFLKTAYKSRKFTRRLKGGLL